MKYACVLFLILLLSCNDRQTIIKIKGSDTEVNLAVNLAEQFHTTQPAYTISVSGGGSGMGIASILKKQADIANSSRPLTQEEEDLFKKMGIELKTFVFAEDATAIIVHNNFPLDTIDVPTLSKIMSGGYQSWKEVTGKDLPITIYGRQSNSGTHSFIKKKLKIAFSRDAKEMNGNAQIMESVKQDESGIGYIGAGYISADNKSVKILKISEQSGKAAISPLDQSAINAMKYFFQRPLYQFIPISSWQKVQTFLQFEKSEEGKSIIKKEGYYIL